ncbi:MFS transporter [Neobacillus terrae]|uniref:MFS transporter n=1 Tax=Neobacillus terrae TaxID=3034837 RepID=UPI001407A8F3|nr:MFS transporter [Neobacillus terrae]NHM31153.1 MFS transporter [Neobacillus terrae]
MYQTILREKSYRKLFLAGVVNGIGDRFSQVALLTLILEMTGSGLAVGVTMALRMIPFLLFAPFSSRFAKKWTRKRVLITTDLVRAFIAISFLFINSAADMWIVYAGSFLLSAGEALYAPARKAGIPVIVQKKSIKDVNAWEQVSLGIVLIVGAFTGGIVSFLLGPKAAFFINILSFAAAAYFISGIPSLENRTVKMSSKETVHDVSIARLAMTSVFLIMLMTFDLLNPLINGIENVLLSVYAVKVFQMGGLGVGIFYSVLGTGLLMSPLVSGLIKKNFLSIAFIGLLMEGVVLTGISQVHSFVLAALLFGILTLFSGVGNTLMDTAVMQTIPAKHHGAYFAFSATVTNTCLGLSMFLSGLALEGISPRTLGLLGGFLYILLGAIYFLWSAKIDLRKESRQLVNISIRL